MLPACVSSISEQPHGPTKGSVAGAHIDTEQDPAVLLHQLAIDDHTLLSSVICHASVEVLLWVLVGTSIIS